MADTPTTGRATQTSETTPGLTMVGDWNSEVFYK
jgi:hypothetical protein